MIIRASTPAPLPHQESIKQFRVLIVDDSTLFIQSIRKMLSQLKVEDKNISHASDTRLASWYLRDRKDSNAMYDIIICSYTFKGKPMGREFLRYLEKEKVREKLTALIMTDNAMDLETLREVDTFLPDGFITKPFNHNQFLKKFSQITDKGIRIKAVKTAYYQQQYEDVLRLTQKGTSVKPSISNELLRLRCMSLSKLKRYDEAITLCTSLLDSKREWPLVTLIELYSLKGQNQHVSELLASTPAIKEHPRVNWMLRESEVTADNFQKLIGDYKKAPSDHEKTIKAAMLHLYSLDYQAAIDTLTMFIRHNRSNPLLDKRTIFFLKGLKALNHVFVGGNTQAESKELSKLTDTKDPQYKLYYLFLYILKHYDKKNLFATGQRIEAFRNRAIYAKDNMVLLLLALACHHLGLHSKVTTLFEQRLTFVENDYLSIVTNKVLSSLVQLNDDKELHFDTKRDADLSTLVSMTHSSPLNRQYHEGFISQLADIVKRRKVKKSKEMIAHIESSIAYLKDSYEELGQISELVRLKSEYELIKVNL
ncbi:response regulator [Vibrio sp. RE88]|uniref:response regulator n=1 Tax=Vibrio sp. RE88 TaxID=2607610 RepID=UPI001493C54F|nr:response regulator [Vibrio sp. RE88]NOH62503.1 response regulator [Vibrio sp. RE88]